MKRILTTLCAGVAAGGLVSPAQAVTVTSTSTTFSITNFGGPICEVSTNSPILLGATAERFGLDYYHIGVTDASGTIGINNLGAPTPDQARAVSVGGTAVGQGFIDRANILNPMFLTIWEGTPNLSNPNLSDRGTMLAQIPIPQSALTAGPFPCLPLNAAPAADAGADQSNVVPGSTVTLDGSASTDPDNDTLTYSWAQISGPPVALSNPASAAPSFIAPGGASTVPIIFQLIVNDGTVSSVADTVTIAVQDNIATAQAQIGEFIAQRNAILLSNQPDIQRRIDRLNGASQPQSNSGLAGAFAPMHSRAPLSIFAAQGQAQASTSLAQASGGRADGAAGSWDIWAEARFIDTSFGARDGTAAIVYGGVDKALSDNVLLGVMGQYDELDAKNSATTGVLDGEGWMAGPYVTLRLSDSLYLDARAAYGETRNRISPFGTYTDTFETDRILLAATITGEIEPAEGLIIRPEAAIVWIGEDQKAYVDSLSSPIPAQSFDMGQVSLAPRIMYSAALDRQFTLRPFVEARGIYSFGDKVSALIGNDTRLRIEGGADLLGSNGLRIGLSGFHDGIGNSGFTATGARLSISLTF